MKKIVETIFLIVLAIVLFPIYLFVLLYYKLKGEEKRKSKEEIIKEMLQGYYNG